MSTKKTPRLPRRPLYIASVALYGGFILTLAGLFVEIGVHWAFVGFAIVVIGAVIKARADKLQRELSPSEVYDIFAETWLYTKSPLNVLEITERHIEGERGTDLPEQVAGMATIEWKGKRYAIAANGNGPLDAFVSAMKQTPAPAFNITSFHEHSVGSGSDTQAMAYVQITKENGEQVWGVGKSSNVGRAGIAAVVSALNFK